LQSAGKIAQQASGSYCNTADDAQVTQDTMSFECSAGGDHGWVEHIKIFIVKFTAFGSKPDGIRFKVISGSRAKNYFSAIFCPGDTFGPKLRKCYRWHSSVK